MLLPLLDVLEKEIWKSFSNFHIARNDWTISDIPQKAAENIFLAMNLSNATGIYSILLDCY